VYVDGEKTARTANGVFARAAASEAFTIMAEADVLTRSRRELGYVGYVQLDYEVVQGLHLQGTAEGLDAGFPKGRGPSQLDKSAGSGKPEGGAWATVQWFFLPHFDVRVDAIFRQDTQVLTQLHVYL